MDETFKPEPFEARIASTGAILHVPADRSLLDVLREHGFSQPSSCELGVCGACECGYRDGTVIHRDGVLSVGKRRESNRRERCTATLTALSKAIPAPCDTDLMRALSEAAEQVCPGRWQVMPSGAGHDAQNIARILPAAMLFVPSIGGISHHWAEDTSDADLAFGVRALGAAATRLLAR